MRKNLKSKVLLSILAASIFYLPACANAASLEITNATQATDSTISDWLHEPIREHSGKAIYHEAEADGNQLSVTGEPEFLKDYTDLTAAYKKIGDNSSYDLEKNEVSITGGNFSQTRYFYGAYGNMRNVQGGTANLTGNNLTISGGNYNIDQLFYYYLYGAYADLYTATDNSEASLTGNSVILKNDATFNKRAIVYGAYANFNDSSNPSNFNAAASLADNTVTVNGGQYNSGASFHGAYATLMTANLNAQPADTAIPTVNLTGNKVTVSNTAFNNSNNIYGAYINLQDANGMYNSNEWDTREFNITAVLQNNSVTVDSSTFNSNDTYTYNTRIYGANAYLFYAVNSKADLLNNTVAINGGKFETATNVYGAYINLDHNGTTEYNSENSDVNSYDNVASTVSGNNVTISGGEFNAATNVYGAYADLTYNQNTADNVYPAEKYYTSTAAITDNTVTLTGSAGAYDEATQARDLKNVNLYGYAYNETDKDVRDSQITDHSNNNLIVDGWSGTVGSVNNFENINFENIKVAGK